MFREWPHAGFYFTPTGPGERRATAGDARPERGGRAMESARARRYLPLTRSLRRDDGLADFENYLGSTAAGGRPRPESTPRGTAAGERREVRGRFAPTPNGPLHLGSVVAAVASHLSARHRGGEWHVRIDDVDVVRVVPGAADAILRELERLALPWDGPVVRQRDNTERYRDALARLERGGWTFGCACTRREAGPGPYPGTCRDGTPRPARSVRMRADSRIAFHDAVQGEVEIDLPAETGDFIVYRADRIHAYHLAAAVDDAALGVTEIVRGADLLASTGPQVHVQRALGFPAPAHAHVPVATTAAGAKLAKSSAAPASAERPAAVVLRATLGFLGLLPPAGIDDPAGLVEWGTRHWDLARVPRVREAPLAGSPGPGRDRAPAGN